MQELEVVVDLWLGLEGVRGVFIVNRKKLETGARTISAGIP